MERQTKLAFNVRKKSLRSSKDARDKENSKDNVRSGLQCADGSFMMRRATESKSKSCYASSSSDDESDSGVECKVTTKTTPAKRKGGDKKEHISPPKMTKLSAELTPSTHLKSLTLNSPGVKNSHVNCAEEQNLPPKELQDPYSKLKIALHTHSTNSLPGREAELEKLNNFIMDRLHSRASGSLYVSGPPGTGKTACLTNVMHQPDVKGKFRTVYINCTSMKTPRFVYSQIATQLSLKTSGTIKESLSTIEKHLQSNQKLILLVLDEIDQLATRGQSVLYTIFEWPSTYPTGLVLIGIANALDLTDRILPRLKSQVGLAPELLHFATYSKQQLLNILTQRLIEAGVKDMASPTALQLLATKIAAMTGDVRKALDLARRVVELVEQNELKEELLVDQICNSRNSSDLKSDPLSSPKKLNFLQSLVSDKSPLKERCSPNPIVVACSTTESLNSPRKSLLSLFNSPSKGKSPVKKSVQSETSAISSNTKSSKGIDVKGVMTVLNEVYGSSNVLGRSADGTGEELPLQQKLAICSLLLILRKGKNKDITVGKLHEVYRRVCSKRHMDPLDQASFLSMLGLIEARGILHIQGRGKPNRLSKVCLQWVDEEVIAALKDRELLASIMNDAACLV